MWSGDERTNTGLANVPTQSPYGRGQDQYPDPGDLIEIHSNAGDDVAGSSGATGPSASGGMDAFRFALVSGDLNLDQKQQKVLVSSVAKLLDDGTTRDWDFKHYVKKMLERHGDTLEERANAYNNVPNIIKSLQKTVNQICEMAEDDKAAAALKEPFEDVTQNTTELLSKLANLEGDARYAASYAEKVRETVVDWANKPAEISQEVQNDLLAAGLAEQVDMGWVLLKEERQAREADDE